MAGRNLMIDYRFGALCVNRMPDFAKELARHFGLSVTGLLQGRAEQSLGLPAIDTDPHRRIVLPRGRKGRRAHHRATSGTDECPAAPARLPGGLKRSAGRLACRIDHAQ